MSELPNGWAHASLGEIAETIRGVTYKKAEAESEAGDGRVPMLRATNVVGGRLDLESQLVYVPAKRVSNAQFLSVGDIVIASSSGSSAVVGKSAPLTHEWSGTFGAFCSVARPRYAIEASYLAYYVGSETVRRRWSHLASGTNINNLKREHFTETPVPLPPLNEQRRIVAAIEEQLSRLDAADASLDAAKTRAGRFQEAILEEAFSNHAQHRRVGDIAALTDGPFGSNLKTSHYVAVGPRVVRLQNIGGGFFRDEKAHITQEHFEGLSRHAVVPGDVVVASLGGEAPRACLVPEWLGDAIVKAESSAVGFRRYP